MSVLQVKTYREYARLCVTDFPLNFAVYNPAHYSHSRVLFYVEDGNVTLKPKVKPGVTHDPFKSSTSVGPDVVWGGGGFLSLFSFLFGEGRIYRRGAKASEIAYAYSERVTMRIWCATESENHFKFDDPGEVVPSLLRRNPIDQDRMLGPMRINGLDARDVDLL